VTKVFSETKEKLTLMAALSKIGTEVSERNSLLWTFIQFFSVNLFNYHYVSGPVLGTGILS
jgi:hypothetical protein